MLDTSFPFKVKEVENAILELQQILDLDLGLQPGTSKGNIYYYV